MAYLRCTHCGAKALSAASQCPKCTTPFDLHDAKGARVALKGCRGCGFMHRIDRHCHWCGELAPRFRMPADIGRTMAAAALAISVAGGLWRGAPALWMMVRGMPRTAALPPVVRLEDGAGSLIAGALAGDVGRAVDGDSAALMTVASNATSADRSALASPSTLVGSDSIAWVPAVARTWVNVRADASRGGDVVGVIKPASRAMLGTGRGGWRQVRSPDVKGWVDPRLFEPDSTGPRGQ